MLLRIGQRFALTHLMLAVALATMTQTVSAQRNVETPPPRRTPQPRTLYAQESDAPNEGASSSAGVLQSVRDAVVTTIAPNSWSQVGGEGSVAIIERWNLLVVHQTEQNHRLIHELLNAIQRVVAARNGKLIRSGVDVHEGLEIQDRKVLEKIRAELAKATKVDFIDDPLCDAIIYLENLHGIQIELDLRALGESAISVDKPIDKQLSGISLRSALDLMLRDLGLSHTLRNGVVLITTPDALETLETTKVYDLSNVVSP